MTAFLAEQCQNGSRDYRGFLFFFEAPKNKRITLSTTVAELYARENQCLVDDRSICIHNF